MTRSSSRRRAATTTSPKPTTATTTRTRTAETERPFAFAVGANLGAARETIGRAVEALARRFGPLRVAPLYLTEPVSAIPQPDYLNTVVLGRTRESPERLLAFARRLERRLGRTERGRDAPREIDLDLLFVGELERASDALVLPHPRLRQRRFVLAPLADLAPELPLPPDGEPVRRALARLPAGPRVTRLREAEPAR